MIYCKLHKGKAYSEFEIDNMKNLCPFSGCYQDVSDKLIRIYCFELIEKKFNPDSKKLCVGKVCQ